LLLCCVGGGLGGCAVLTQLKHEVEEERSARRLLEKVLLKMAEEQTMKVGVAPPRRAARADRRAGRPAGVRVRACTAHDPPCTPARSMVAWAHRR
jgi:hypothetical protein